MMRTRKLLCVTIAECIAGAIFFAIFVVIDLVSALDTQFIRLSQSLLTVVLLVALGVSFKILRRY